MRFVITALLIALLAGCGGGGHASGGGPTPYSVTATAGTGGTISPASASVSTGTTASFAVSVASGYAVDAASGCGGTLNGNTYTTASVTANCAITVTFKALDFHVDVTGNGVGGLVIANNGTEQLALDGNGRFTFTSGIHVGSTYAVRVTQQPVAQVCRVANGDGVISATVPVTISVQCVNRITSALLMTLRTSVDSSGAFTQFLYVRSPEMDLHQFKIRQSDGGLDEVGPPWSVAPYAQTFVFSGNGARAFADNGVGDVSMANVRESDGVLVPAWTSLFGNYVPVLPILLTPVRPSSDAQILYRNMSFIIGGTAHRDVWSGVVSDTGVSLLGPPVSAFEIGSDGGGPNFDLSDRYFARQVRVSGTIEVYAAFTSATVSPQLLTQVTKTLSVNLDTSMITEASPGRFLYEASRVSASGAAQVAPPQVAVYWWRPDGAFEPLGGALTLGDLTGEIASEVCVGTTTTSRSSAVHVLAATADSSRYLVQRQDTTCTGIGGTGLADSRVLGVYRLTVANGQPAVVRMALDAFPGWADHGTGGAQHPTKPWLYLGSKHAQRVYAYAVDASGAAQPIAGSPFDGQTVPAPTTVAAPSVVMDPTGRYLYMARYTVDPGPTYVDAFSIDQTTGALTPIATYTP